MADGKTSLWRRRLRKNGGGASGAAFKAVAAGKQVAILVPTTILAMQHYQTILSRMRGFPVQVDMLSRFRTKAEQAETLRRLRPGRA